MSDYLHQDDARGDWVDHECSQGGSIAKAEARWDVMIAKIKADALREAADALPKPVGLNCNKECHDVDWASLRVRADRIEAEA